MNSTIKQKDYSTMNLQESVQEAQSFLQNLGWDDFKVTAESDQEIIFKATRKKDNSQSQFKVEVITNETPDEAGPGGQPYYREVHSYRGPTLECTPLKDDGTPMPISSEQYRIGEPEQRRLLKKILQV